MLFICHSCAPTFCTIFDAVARVELPTLELEGVALEVGVLEILVELEAARGHDDALASLDRLLLGADHRVRADDLLGLGVLDETLVVAVEQNLHAQLLALRVELAERQHAEAVDGGQLAGALVGVVVQEVVLGDGAGQRDLGHLVGHAVLVGVLGVANALVDPGVDHRLGGLAVRERLDVLLEALFVAFLDDGPLAVVDAAVAAALDGSLLQHDDFLAALVGADERRPHARASVADDQEVALVVPALRQPLLRRACVRRAAGQRGGTCHSGGSDARSLQKRAARQPSLFFRAHCLSFSLHCFGFALNGRRLRLPYAGCVRLPSSSTPYFFLSGDRQVGSIGAEPLGRSIRYAMKRRLLYWAQGTVPHRAREAGFDERGEQWGRVCGTSSRHFALTGNRWISISCCSVLRSAEHGLYCAFPQLQ